MKFLLFLVIMYCWASLSEYVAHRWLMHGKSRQGLEFVYNDHMDHHKSYPARGFSSGKGAERFKGLTLCIEHGIIFVIPLASFLALWDPSLSLLSFLFIVVHFFWYNKLHSGMHLRTKMPWMPKVMKLFIIKNHFIHHCKPNSNFCVSFPGADYLFGTTAKLNKLETLYWQRVRKRMEDSEKDEQYKIDIANECLISWKRFFRWLGWVVIGDIKVEGELPPDARLIVANHPSWRDVKNMKTVFPNVQIMANDSVLFWTGPMLRAQGCFSHKVGIKRGVEIIKDGNLCGICAEGWTTLTGQVNQFKRGALVIAQEANVPIIPVAITYTKYRGEWINALPPVTQWILDLLLGCRKGSTVKIGKPVKLEDLPGEDLLEKAESLRRIVIDLANDPNIY